MTINLVGPYQPLYEGATQIGYQPPPGCLGSLDLRPLADQAVLTGGGSGLFLMPDGTDLGNDYLVAPDELTPQQLTQLENKLGLDHSGRPLNLWQFAVHLLTYDAQPDGQTWAQPLMPDARGRMRLYLGSLRASQKWQQGDPQNANAKLRFQATYGQLRAASETHARRWLGYQVRKLKLTGNQWEELQPLQYRGETPLPPQTIITESWPGGDTTGNIDGDNTWTEGANWDKISNEAKGPGVNNPASPYVDRFARCEADTSGDDCKTKCSKFDYQHSSATQQMGLTVRHSTSSRNTAYIMFSNENVNRLNLYKVVSGAFTSLDSIFGTPYSGITWPVSDAYVQADGSTITGECYAADGTLSATDTAITGNTRGGLYWTSNIGTNVSIWDGWQTADLQTMVKFQRPRQLGVGM